MALLSLIFCSYIKEISSHQTRKKQRRKATFLKIRVVCSIYTARLLVLISYELN